MPLSARTPCSGCFLLQHHWAEAGVGRTCMRPWRPCQWSVFISSSPGRHPAWGSLVLKEHRVLPPASSPAARGGFTDWEEPPGCGRGARPLRATVGCNGGSQLRQHVGDYGSFFKCNHSLVCETTDCFIINCFSFYFSCVNN